MSESEKARESKALAFRMLGHLTLEDGLGGQIKVTNRKACGLLAYLALNEKPTETRERLAGLLWSDRGEQQARASLRQCLKQLRTKFDEVGFEGFETDRQDVALRRDRIQIDIRTISEALAEGDVPEQLLSEGGEPERILYGFESLDQSFGAWLHVIRQNWHDRFVERLQYLLRNSPKKTSRRAADALVKVDPSHEEAHRHLIRHHADDGNTTAAITQYNVLWQLLDEEFDMEPDEETQALIAEIKAGTYVRSENMAVDLATSTGVGVGEAVAAPALPDPSFAPMAVRYPVLQIRHFVSSGPTGSDAGLVEGFRRDLLASLVRFRDWIVIEADPDISSATAAGADGIDYEVDGTFFNDGGETHLIVTLKNHETGQYIWSERLKLTLDNWFAAQRRFVMRISAGLSINLSARHIAQHITKHEVPEDTYNLWLEAYRLIWSWDPDERNAAETMFRQVIDRCPSFAPAYSGLASIYNTEQMIYPGVTPQKVRLEEAAQLARLAVSMDPLDVRNQIALAWSNGMTGRYDQAKNNHQLVYELNPNNPTTLISCANGLSMCGDVETAKRMSDEAVNHLPTINRVQWGYLASTRFICGDYAGAVAAADQANHAIPVTPGWRTAALGLIGPREQAERAGKEFLDFVRVRWRGEVPCDPQQVANWFLRHCPIKSEETRRRIREGLRNSGLPDT